MYKMLRKSAWLRPVGLITLVALCGSVLAEDQFDESEFDDIDMPEVRTGLGRCLVLAGNCKGGGGGLLSPCWCPCIVVCGDHMEEVLIGDNSTVLHL